MSSEVVEEKVSWAQIYYLRRLAKKIRVENEAVKMKCRFGKLKQPIGRRICRKKSLDWELSETSYTLEAAKKSRKQYSSNFKVKIVPENGVFKIYSKKVRRSR